MKNATIVAILRPFLASQEKGILCMPVQDFLLSIDPTRLLLI
jgi:hypothetical protein